MGAAPIPRDALLLLTPLSLQTVPQGSLKSVVPVGYGPEDHILHQSQRSNSTSQTLQRNSTTKSHS